MEDWTTVLFIMIILVSTISAITYFDSDALFNAQITSVNADGKFSVDLEIENLMAENLDYDIEIIYKRGNLVVNSQKIQCEKKCQTNIPIDKIFFDKYNVLIKTFYQGRGYQKKLTFKFDKSESIFSVKVPTNLTWETSDLIIPVEITSSPNKNKKFILDIFPTKKPELKSSFIYECQGFCKTEFIINQLIIFGEYTVNIYSQTDAVKSTFVVIPKNITQSQLNQFLPKPTTPITSTEPKQNQSTIIPINPIQENNSIEQSTKELNIETTKINLSQAKLKRNYSELNENISELIQETKQESNTDTITVIDLGGNEIELQNESELLNNNNYVAIVQKNLIKEERPNQIKIKPIIQNINTLQEIDDLSVREIPKQEKIEMKEKIEFKLSTFGAKQEPELVTKDIIGKEEKILERTNKGFERTNLTFEKLTNQETNKLVPGIYKKQERILFADGTDEIKEEYFAYGLITVNTKKPLYKKGELVEFLIVVLDKKGFLVENANIQLEITKPNQESVLLKTEDRQIQSTEKSGVYKAEIYATELGNYNLYAQVDQYDMVVDIETYFNVVEDNKIPFQIIRDVPATIDPWLGPFNNTFSITPETYSGTYDFTEVFSSDFTNITTNADTIETKDELTYLTWNNLQSDEELFYSAQVPLVTPYLYELGKSYVEFDSEIFYENRPWLFAIDPEAKVCGNKGGPGDCFCGTPCAGGNGEPASGDGTIDNCADTDATYEWVNEITVENTDGSPYFGTGNIVTVCISVRVDNQERVSLFYMDHSANGGTTFGNGGTGIQTRAAGVTNIYESYNLDTDDGDHTYCTTTAILNDYVGKHYIRGKQAYQGTADRVCQGAGGWRDQDDISFEVLDKVAPTFNSWDITNGTTTSNIVNVIRGKNATVTTNWNLPLQSGAIEHNGAGSPNWYSVDSYENNQTNYTLLTNNTIEFNSVGPTLISRTKANDFYFNLPQDQDATDLTMNIYGVTKINQSILSPYIIFEGNTSTMSCQVTDENVGVPYQNKIIEFFKGSTSLGTNTTNANGWSSISFQTPLEGIYNITCKIIDEPAKYYLASETNYNETKSLTVKPAGADINPPIISNIQNLTATIFAVGSPFIVKANFSDDISLKEIFVSFKNPSVVETTHTISAFDNLVGHWNFDKKTPLGIEDFGPNNIFGTFQNSATVSNVGGIRNNYGTFDGASNLITTDLNLSQFVGGRNWTFSSWIKWEGGSEEGCIFGEDNVGDNLCLGVNNNLLWVRASSTSNVNFLNTDVSDSGWHHVIFRNNGTHLTGYLDGILGEIKNLNLDLNDTNLLWFGSQGGSTRYFNGNLDDIWLFNRSLESWEISNLYTHNSILNSSYEFEYSGTSEDGIYPYYFRAEDISENPTLSSTLNFNAIGVRTFLGAQTTKALYKVGQSVAMTSTVYTNDYANTPTTELGDLGYILYDFTTGLQDWTSGVLSGSTNNWAHGADTDCPNQPCIATTINGNVGINTNQYIESPQISFLGRDNIKISFFRVFDSDTGTTDRAYLEGYDGSDWDYVITQDAISGGGSWAAAVSQYSASDLNNLPDTKFRFRLTSDGTANYEGWRVDDINISFNPREEWDNDWHNYDTTFGSNEQKLTALKFDINITAYDNTGSIAKSNNNPDLEIQVYNGSEYKYSHTCSLNSGLTYPTTCSFLIKKNDEYLTAWQDNTNRNIRIRATGMDQGDSITWNNIKREYVTPSVIENHGQIPINNLLLQQIKNSSGHVVATIYNNVTNIAAGANLDLSTLGTFIVPIIPLGDYIFYSALTDLSGNVLENGDDGSLVEDSYGFEIDSLYFENILPDPNIVYGSAPTVSFDLVEGLFTFGGLCQYSLNGAANQTIPNTAGSHFETTLSSLPTGINNIVYYCNDSDNDIINTPLLEFDVGLKTRQDLQVNKSIIYNSTNNNYLVQYSIRNLETATQNKSILNYIDSDYNVSNFTLIPTNNKSFGGNFPGMVYWWNISLGSEEIFYLNYTLTNIGNSYFIGRNIMLGID